MRTIRLRPDGSVDFLYVDGHPAIGLGKMEVERASDVFFDPEKQKWVVHIRGEAEPLPQVFEDRAAALKYEVDYLNIKMLD